MFYWLVSCLLEGERARCGILDWLGGWIMFLDEPFKSVFELIVNCIPGRP